ncbi:MAG: sugar ABC transporter permease [Lachnospiraceae bacterium]|nr:sugar ABC transporter permease [Lachnospiraceae bacterium]
MDRKEEGLFKKAGTGIANFFKWIGTDIKEIGVTFAEGDWKTRVSYLIMGFGSIMRKSFARGIGFLVIEIAFIYYLVSFGWDYMKDIGTLGTIGEHKEEVLTKAGPMKVTVYGDNSFLILLYGLLTIIFIVFFIFVWRLNVRENRKEELLLKEGKKIPTTKEDLSSLLDANIDKTLLALPVLGIFVFTVLPIIFMICVAFTNYDYNHQAPAKLFTWVGFDNFSQLFSFGSNGFGGTFFKVLGWTLVWAFFATFLNYFIGMAVAILINKKGIKLKKLWRTILVMTIAIPQFVSLLYVSKMFANDGLINSYLMKWGWISSTIPFWTNPTLARITIIVINLWIGIPYMMLIATGLLMNIPADLYESARIDGANAFQMFFKITLPYMLFVTGPFLLTQFTGNLNNFNVIYLLSGGGPKSMKLSGSAGSTDLLVTWLYKMTVTDTNYRMAAVIGIMVFAVTAIVSLGVYNLLPSVKDEEGFQ